MSVPNVPITIKDNVKGQLNGGINASSIVFALKTGDGAYFPETRTGTTTSGGTNILLNQTGVGATSPTIKVGDMIYNIADGSQAVVTGVNTDSLNTTELHGGTGDTWDSGDKWTINPFVITLLNWTGTAFDGDPAKMEKVLILERNNDTLKCYDTANRGISGTTPNSFSADDYVVIYFEQEMILWLSGLASYLIRTYALDSKVFKKDGSVTATGNFKLGTKRITGMGDPVNNQDATTKAWVLANTGSSLSVVLSENVSAGNVVSVLNDGTDTKATKANRKTDSDITNTGVDCVQKGGGDTLVFFNDGSNYKCQLVSVDGFSGAISYIGSAITIASGAGIYTRVVFWDSINSQFLCLHIGAGYTTAIISLKISGTTITKGTAVTIAGDTNHRQTQERTAIFDNANSRLLWFYIYNDGTTDKNLFGKVVKINGVDSFSVGTEQTLKSDGSYYKDLLGGYHEDASKYFLLYKNNTAGTRHLNQLTVTDTTIALGTNTTPTYDWSALNRANETMRYSSSLSNLLTNYINTTIHIAYIDSSGAITDIVDTGLSSSYPPSPVEEYGFIFGYDQLYDTSGTLLQSYSSLRASPYSGFIFWNENFIFVPADTSGIRTADVQVVEHATGVMAESGTTGQTKQAILLGGQDDSGTGLRIGGKYYIQTNATLGLTPTDFPFGIAVSPTKILLTKSP